MCLSSPRFLAAYYFWYFAAIGVFEPYLTPFWQHLGFSPAQLGLLNAIYPGVAAFAPFAWTAYSDVTRRGEVIFLFNTWLSAGIALVLPNLNSVVPVALAFSAFATFRTPLIPLANSMAFRVLADSPQRFASIRLWGTIGYIMTAVGAGILVDRVGLWAGMQGIALATVACGVVAWIGQSRGGANLSPVHLRDILELLRDRRLALVLAAASLARLSFGPYTTFFTIHLEGLGLSRTFAGVAWALAAVSELVVMVLWSRLCGLASARTWLTLAMGAHALRWLLSVPARDPIALLLIQMTHALTFGVFYLAAVEQVEALAPEGLRATAQGLFASVTFGLSGLLGNALSGFLFEPLGMAWLYTGAGCVAAVATALYWAGTRPSASATRALMVGS
ncbi:MAG TPA: MFS transporter [Candidatus Methylomirabilis sp.]|nr:MFS transporter [Candidatus Methylomirabilis sp.]